MNFGAKHLLWLLLFAPAMGLLLWWSLRARQRAMSQFIGSRLLASLTVGLSRTRQKIRAALLLAALTLLLFSMARPQWGYGVEEARQRGLDLVVAIDTSKSMLADDLQPNRLARAKLAALDLMRLARTDRLGLVAFAGTAFLQCPLSLDDEAFRQSIEALDVNIIPQGGTAVAEAIQTGLAAFKDKSENHKIIVLFTDGEDNDEEGSALNAAQAAAKEGMRIFTIGVGTPAGELLSTTDPYNNRVFIKDSAGNVVKSRLNEPLLQRLAKETDGFYLPLAGASTMEVLYERGLAPLPKSDFAAKSVRQFHERFQWFLGAAILLLLSEMFFPERVTSPKSKGQGTKPISAAAVVLCLGFLASDASASVSDALKHYERGRFARARDEFERLARKAPDDARLRYNAGAAAFQGESYDDALRHFSASLSSPDIKLQQRSYYNLGNTQFRLGDRAQDPKQKQQSWEQAMHDYENALKLDPQDGDAKFNHDLVKEKLEELKKQQQQKQQQDQNKDDKKDDQENKDQQKQDKQEQKDQKKDESKDQQQQEKSDQEKKDEQASQQDQQKKEDQSKGEQQKQQDQQAAQDQRGAEPGQEAAQYGKVMQMTPQQAVQLLEAQKSEEKAMVFVPQNVRTNKNSNPKQFKDW